MKSWALACMASSVIAAVAKFLLPDKENGKISRGFAFVCSLVTAVIAFSPVLSLLSGNSVSPDFQFSYQKIESADIEASESRKTLDAIRETAAARFDGEDFFLEAVLDGGGMIEHIGVISEDPEFSERIALFIKATYGIETEVKQNG